MQRRHSPESLSPIPGACMWCGLNGVEPFSYRSNRLNGWGICVRGFIHEHARRRNSYRVVVACLYLNRGGPDYR